MATASPSASPPSGNRESYLRVARSEIESGLVAHRSELRAHARSLTRNASETEDLLQETALRALSFAASFEPGSNARAWLHQVLRSVFVTQCRRSGRERRSMGLLAVDPCAWVKPDPVASMPELSPRVERALNELPSGFRDAVRLVDVCDLSYRDAARSLDVPLGTVMSRLHRGRRMLATALASEREAPKAA